MTFSPSSSSPPIVIGGDPPQPPATSGFAFNHTALQVSDLAASLKFYKDILGFREVFTFAFAKSGKNGEVKHKVTGLAYPVGDGKRAFQTGEQLLGDMLLRDGILELFSSEVSITPRRGRGLRAGGRFAS